MTETLLCAIARPDSAADEAAGGLPPAATGSVQMLALPAAPVLLSQLRSEMEVQTADLIMIQLSRLVY